MSGYAVKRDRELNRVESALKDKGADFDIIKATRLKESKPILDKLKVYLDKKSRIVPKSSPVGKAIQYALNRAERAH